MLAYAYISVPGPFTWYIATTSGAEPVNSGVADRYALVFAVALFLSSVSTCMLSPTSNRPQLSRTLGHHYFPPSRPAVHRKKIVR